MPKACLLVIIPAILISHGLAETPALPLWASFSHNRQEPAIALRRGNGDGHVFLQLKGEGDMDLGKLGSLSPICDVLRDQEKIAVLLDLDFSFDYRLYRKVDGKWALQCRQSFCELNTGRRQSLCLAELLDISTARVTFFKGGYNYGGWRKEGEVKEGDPKDVYEFKSDSTILKNGAAYNYQLNR